MLRSSDGASRRIGAPGGAANLAAVFRLVHKAAAGGRDGLSLSNDATPNVPALVTHAAAAEVLPLLAANKISITGSLGFNLTAPGLPDGSLATVEKARGLCTQTVAFPGPPDMVTFRIFPTASRSHAPP